MGFMNFFLSDKNGDNRNTRRNSAFDSLRETGNDGFNKSMDVASPKSFDDVESIINSLKTGHPVILNLENVSEPTAVRIMDMLCGAIYALDGNVARVGNNANLYAFSINGVNEK